VNPGDLVVTTFNVGGLWPRPRMTSNPPMRMTRCFVLRGSPALVLSCCRVTNGEIWLCVVVTDERGEARVGWKPVEFFETPEQECAGDDT